MNYVRKTYVELLSYDHSLIREVETRDISKLEVSTRFYGFRFFDILSVSIDVDGEKIELKSEKINLSPRYSRDKLHTFAEPEARR